MKNIQLVIFDMDGVLVDACELHRVALNEAIVEICNYQISVEEHYKEYNGLPTKVKLKKLNEKGLIQNSQIEAIENLKQQKTVSSILKTLSIRQEKIDLMQSLKDVNIKIGCFTNSIRTSTELMLEKTGILKYFDVIITNQDVTKSKPDPEGYLLCMQKLQIDKNNCLIVEDSENGIKAAKASGAHFIKVENPDEVNKNLFKELI